MNPLPFVAAGIFATLMLGVVGYFTYCLYRLGSAILAHAGVMDLATDASNRVANNFHGIVPALNNHGEIMRSHVSHVAGLVAVIEKANADRPPLEAIPPVEPKEENYTANIPPSPFDGQQDGDG